MGTSCSPIIHNKQSFCTIEAEVYLAATEAKMENNLRNCRTTAGVMTGLLDMISIRYLKAIAHSTQHSHFSELHTSAAKQSGSQ